MLNSLLAIGSTIFIIVVISIISVSLIIHLINSWKHERDGCIFGIVMWGIIILFCLVLVRLATPLGG